MSYLTPAPPTDSRTRLLDEVLGALARAELVSEDCQEVERLKRLRRRIADWRDQIAATLELHA